MPSIMPKQLKASEDVLEHQGGSKRAWKNQPLLDAIVANEAYRGTAQYRSINELATTFNVKPTTIYTYRGRLGFKKLIKLRPTTSPHLGQGLHNFRSPEDLIRAVSDEPILSPLDRLKVLSSLIRLGSPQIKILAIKTLEDLSRTTEGRVGPPTPLTEEDRVARLIRLFLAVGETTVKSAYAIAFTPPSPQPEETIQPNPTGLRPPPFPSQGTLPDLPLPTPDPLPGG